MSRFPRMIPAAFAGVALAALAEPAGAKEPTNAELRCLALNVYWEARSGSPADQLAIAYVTLNRVESGDFPNSVCEVVRQGGEKRHKCQFSWWCDGNPDQPTNAVAWREAIGAARKALSAQASDPTGGALYFHHDTVRPDWADRLTQTAAFGRHIFYK